MRGNQLLVICFLVVAKALASKYEPVLNQNNQIETRYEYHIGKPHEPFAEQVNYTRDFMDRMGHLEGSGDYAAVSPSGTYIGKYQFGPLALKEVGHRISRSKFKKNPAIFPKETQDEVFLKLCLVNIDYLEDEIDEFSGQTIKGVKVTKAGMIAAAHLVGYYGVKKFLYSNGRIDPRDGNGTRCSRYMARFSDMDDEQINFKKELETAQYVSR